MPSLVPSPAARVKFLFGGPRPWDPSSWTASDDRVRGGRSVSHLTAAGSGDRAVFQGHLDITALGGAGFASQRTVDPQAWDLTGCDALVLDVAESDGKEYTLVLKDTIPPGLRPRPVDGGGSGGPEPSTVSWEYDFVVPGPGAARIVVPLRELHPTYRGRPKPDAEPLDLANVKRVSFMMRRQEGDFRLVLNSLSATKLGESNNPAAVKETQDEEE